MSFAQRAEWLSKNRRIKNIRSRSAKARFKLESLEDRTVPALASAVGPDLWYAGPGQNSSAQLGQSLYFLAHQGSSAPGTTDIWRVDGGTTAQAVNVPALAGRAVSEIVNVNGSLFVTAYSLPTNAGSLPPTMPADVNVWKLDAAAPGGATKLTDFQSSGAANLQAADGRLFFQRTANSGMTGSSSVNEIWSTDGTVAGTQRLATFAGDTHADLMSAVAAGGDLYFQVYSAQSPTPPDLWVTDGTTSGTHAVTSGGSGGAPAVVGFGPVAVGDSVFYSSANSTGTETKLWRVEDGQATLVRTFGPTSGSTIAPVVGDMTASGGKLYFALNSEIGGEIWVSDGTTNGTEPLYQPEPGASATAIGDLAVLNGDVYFAANTGGGLSVINAQGGANAVPMPAGIAGIFPSLSVVDNQLFFIADNGVHGAELWSTDGTLNGTARRTDINPGSGSTYPVGPLTSGGSEYVVASDNIVTSPAMYTPTRLWKLNDARSQPSGVATIELTSSSNSIAIGGSVNLTATVRPTDAGRPTPTGQVVFRDALQVFGTSALVNGAATFTATIRTPGSHSLQAVYVGDSNYDSRISPAVNVTATQSPVDIILTSSDASSDRNQVVTFTARVQPESSSSSTPTGFVSFFDGATFLGSGLLNNGVASYQTGSLAAGAHSITAKYGGDQSFAAGTSATVTQTVGSTLSIGVTAPSGLHIFGQTINFTARMTAANGAALPVGAQVTFRDGATSIGTAAINSAGIATFTTSALSVGTHTITASYAGTPTITSSPANVTVQKAMPTLSLRSTAQTSRVGQSVTLTATIREPSTGMPPPTGQVIFKDGTTTLGTATVSNGRAVLLLSSLSLGSHAITATYQGNANYTSAASNLTQTVTAANVATTTRLEVPPSAISRQTVNLTAYVKPTVGTAIPTGSVTFRDGSTVIGTTLLDPTGKALLLTNSLSVGNHSITASFGGSGIFTGSASAASNVAIRLASKATLTSSASVVVFSQGVTLTATIAPAVAGGTQPAGSVTFYDNGTAIGTANLVNGTAKLTTNPRTVAIHKLTAVYNGNSHFAPSTTGGFYLNVRAASTAITLQQPSAAAGNMMVLTANVIATAPASGQPSGRVTFMDGSTMLGTANLVNGQAKLQIPRLTAGNHYLRAVYAGSGGYAGASSAIVRATVSGTTAPTAATTATHLEASPATAGQTTNLRATVSSLTPGSIKPSGRVTFRDGTKVLGTATLQNGIATFAVKLTTGSHSLVAAYEGATGFVASHSAALSYVVRTTITAR